MSAESFTLIFRTLRLIGLWSKPSDGWPYLFYTFAVVLNAPYLMLSLIFKTAPSMTGVNDWAMFLSFVLGFAAFSFKGVFFVLFRVRLETLVDTLCTASTSSRFRAKKIFLFFHVLLNVALVINCGIPLLKKLLLKETKQAEFPLDLWFPFDINNTVTYVLAYLWQVLTIVYVSHTAINIDIFFLTVFNEIGLQLEDLNNRLAFLKQKNAEDRDEFLTLDEKFKSLRNNIEYCSPATENDNFMFREIVAGVTHHQTLIRVVDELQTVMNYCMFTQIFFNVVNMTLYVFLLSTSVYSFGNGFTMIATLLMYILQNGFYCWFGDSLIRQSERLMLSVYSCDWTSSSPRCKCALMILMIRASRPLHVKIGRLYLLSRETFLQMLNSSYGLFNVLYTIDSSKEEN